MIISTDPAHNLSDAFDQKFSNTPIQVKGVENLFCIEVDPAKGVSDSDFLQNLNSAAGPAAEGWGEIISSVPGIDEATSFGEIIKMVKKHDYDLVIFDTAPTGHTLRLLNFPNILDKALVKIMELKDKMGPMLSQFGSMMGGDKADD